jgi:predicted RNA-binding protein YlxR (DUF448 family)
MEIVREDNIDRGRGCWVSKNNSTLDLLEDAILALFRLLCKVLSNN